MTCDRCAETIAKTLNLAGVLEKTVSYPDGSARVSFQPDTIDAKSIAAVINEKTGYTVTGIHSLEESYSSNGQHLVIIGGGSAAFAAAIEAHRLGARITMINDGLPLGGTCVNVGCVPSKNLIRAAEALHRARHNPFKGLETTGAVTDFKAIWKQKQDLVKDLRREKYSNIIKDMDRFRLIRGQARFTSNRAVEVNGETISGEKILIATGAQPDIPAIPGLNNVSYLTNQEAFELEELPRSLIVIGGRYIALEIAQLFARLGSKVTVLQRSERILPSQTAELTDALSHYLRNEGITIVTGNDFQVVREKDGAVEIESRVGNETRHYQADKILIATGRTPNTGSMNLSSAGVALNNKGAILTDDYLETSTPGIFAAGDVLGENMFVYTAAYEGQLAVRNAFSGSRMKRDYAVLPWVIFTDPQVAGVGLDEVQAVALGIQAETSVLALDHVPRAIVARDTRGFIKLIRDAATDKLIGARILAPEGAELIMEVSLAIKFGITVREIINTFHPYLTLAEGVKLAAITFGRDVETLSCCAV